MKAFQVPAIMALIKPIELFLGALLLVHGVFLPHAVAGETLAEAAEEAVAEIDDVFSLAGKVVQTAPDLYRQASSDRVLGLSLPLAEAMSVALSEKGARLSSREQGEEPLQVLGRYRLTEEKVEITVRLRRLGLTASTDLATVQVAVDRQALDSALLTDSLPTAVRALLAELERKTYLMETVSFATDPAVPMKTGQAYLRLGQAYTAEIKEAAADSELFGGAVIGAGVKTYRLRPFYLERGDDIVLQIALVNDEQSVVAESRSTIARRNLPPELQIPHGDGNIAVCLVLESSGRGGVLPQTRQGDDLLRFIATLLQNRHGIATRLRQEESCGWSLVLALRLARRRTMDGYALVEGRLTAEVEKQSGNMLGSRHATATSRLQAGGQDLQSLYSNLFNKRLVEDIARDILAYDRKETTSK